MHTLYVQSKKQTFPSLLNGKFKSTRLSWLLLDFQIVMCSLLDRDAVFETYRFTTYWRKVGSRIKNQGDLDQISYRSICSMFPLRPWIQSTY